MEIQVILKHLKPNIYSVVMLNKNQHIRSLEPLSKVSEGIYQDEVLYYGHAQELDSCMAIPNLLVLDKREESKVYFKAQKVIKNLIIIRENLEEMIDLIRTLLQKEPIYVETKEALFQALIRGDDVKEMMLLAHKVLQNPLILTDATYRTIFHYPDTITGDSVWDDLTSKRFLSQENLLIFETDETKAQTLQSDFPIYLDWGFAKEQRRISGILSDGHQIYGFLGVLELNKTFEEIDKDIVDILCKILRLKIQTYYAPSKDQEVYQNTLFANLIDGDLYYETNLKDAITLSHIKWQEPYQIIVISSDMNNQDLAVLKRIRSDLGEFKGIAMHSIIYHTHLVFLVYGPNVNKVRQIISEKLSEHQLGHGISDAYRELLRTSLYFQQATLALNYGIKEKPHQYAHFFKEYRRSHLYDVLSKEVNPLLLLEPLAIEIVQYDRKMDTEYGQTLKQYLQSYKNASLTSEECHIHRNTLTYRLKKIESLFDIDLNESKLCSKLQFSLELILDGQLMVEMRS